MLGSALSDLVFISFFNIFVRSSLLFNCSLYFGLLVFCRVVVFDTQLIIEKAESGEKDFVWDALELFLGNCFLPCSILTVVADFQNIFVRLLILLSKDVKK